mmetsp:Transcript_22368/g.33492  ORF Transcript_22368/g.33492 Transcript_22368/m.33492 type:complete len:88 (+) Transcript_22368:276-539(+)
MLHGNRASAHTSMHRRGQGLQSSMRPSGPHRAGKAGTHSKIRMGGYCTCFIRSNKEGRTESKNAWSDSPRIHLIALVWTFSTSVSFY